MNTLQREARIAQIEQSDRNKDNQARDALYGAAGWLKEKLSGLFFGLLIMLAVVSFICLAVVFLYSVNLAIQAPMAAVTIICFVLWFILLKFARRMKEEFDQKYE